MYIEKVYFIRYPSVVLIDGTHGTNQCGYTLISGLVLDPRYEGIPVFQAIVKSETSDSIFTVLKVFRSRLGERKTAEVQSIITDMSLAFQKPIAQLFPQAKHLKCTFHIDNAWRRKLKDSNMLKALVHLRLQTKVQNFEALWVAFEEEHKNSEMGRWAIYNYGPNGKVCPTKDWAKCYLLGFLQHNVHIERYHR